MKAYTTMMVGVMRMVKFISIILFVGACINAFGVSSVYAEESMTEIEEITVTARRRFESIQDVPIAVTAVSGQLIEDIHLANLIDIGKVSPNVVFTSQSSGGQAMGVSIRGIAFDDLEKSFEPTVGISLDGMFMGTNSGMNLDLWDIESVEILRGPQGTLFGRNTIGGVVNIRRMKPTGELGFKAEVDVGRYDREDVKAALNFPIIPGKVAGKISLRSLQGGGFQHNIARNEDVKGRDLIGGNISVLLTPTDAFEALLRIDFYDDKSEGPENLNMSGPSEALCSAFGLGPLGCRDTSYDVAAADKFKTSVVPQRHLNFIDGQNATLEVNWDLGNYQLTSVTGAQDFDELLDVGFEGASMAVTQFVRPQEYEQLSQEFRISSDAFDSKLDYVAGLFYFSNEYTTTQNFVFFGSTAQLFTSNQELDAIAVFGEANYEVSDALSFTIGGRYTDEEKKFVHDHPVEATGPFSFEGTESWSEFTHRLGVQYSFSGDLMTYASWGTGFRSGGWNGRPATIGGVGPYDPETVESYEIGIRSELADGRLTLNATAFKMDYDDKQEFNVVADPVTGQFDTKIENAAKVSYEGLEIEGLARPSSNHDLIVRFSLGLLDSKFDTRMRDGVNVANQTATLFAPDKTASIGFSYNQPLFATSSLNLSGGLNFVDKHRGRTEIPMEPIADGRDVVPSRKELDLSATLETPIGSGSKFFVSVYGTDLLEDGGFADRPVEIRPLFFVAGMRVRRQYGVRFGIEY